MMREEESDGMTDIVEHTDSCTIHHGPFNSRVYLMSWSPHTLSSSKKIDEDGGISASSSPITACVKKCVDLAIDKKYKKIIIKAPRWAQAHIVDPRGSFSPSAVMRSYYFSSSCGSDNSSGDGANDAIFFTAFVAHGDDGEEEGRRICAPPVLSNYCNLAQPDITAGDSSQDKKKKTSTHPPIRIYQCVNPTVDAPRITRLLRSSFATYPFPCFHDDYVAEAMRSGSAVYFIALSEEEGGRVLDVGCSSAELDRKNLAAEMSDFAVLPSQRGRGVASLLLEHMENFVSSGVEGIGEEEKKRYRHVFSIARATMPAVNVMFYRKGYTFGGCLQRNTNIGGGIEDMNIWSKLLLPS